VNYTGTVKLEVGKRKKETAHGEGVERKIIIEQGGGDSKCHLLESVGGEEGSRRKGGASF